jgi:NADH-quinone oxidoreductase subunit E
MLKTDKKISIRNRILLWFSVIALSKSYFGTVKIHIFFCKMHFFWPILFLISEGVVIYNTSKLQFDAKMIEAILYFWPLSYKTHTMRIARIPVEKVSTDFQDIDLSQIDVLIARYRGKRGNVIPLLQGTQAIYGYIPQPAFAKLSIETGIPLSDLYGVATFYAQFRLAPVGKHIIKVCHGTACHVQAAPKVTEALSEALGVPDGGTTEDGMFTLEAVACLGCCSLAPVMMIGDETYGNLSGKDAVKVVKEIRLAEAQQ